MRTGSRRDKSTVMRRGVRTVLVVGISTPTTRALGRLLGRYFYIERVEDPAQCLRRARDDARVNGVLLDPGFCGIEPASFVESIRKHRAELPVFFYGTAQDIAGISESVCRNHRCCFKSPSEIIRLAEAIAFLLTQGRARPFVERPESRIVVKTLEFIEANYSSINKVTYISCNLGVSREHLSRQFTRFVGHSVWDFVTLYRVEKAKELLCQGALVKQVAREVGFRCESSLSRAFHKYTGITATAYRESILARKAGMRLDSRISGSGS
ncbi:MAG: AraC family transcriptional regulator [Candidatus Eisenbacteria bacterium]